MKYALPFVVLFGLFALALPAEAATVGFSQTEYSVREGDDAQVLIKMVGEVTTSSTVRVLVTSGTARRGVDYESPIISYIQFLPGGLTEKTLTIKTKVNASSAPKTLTLRLLGVTGGGGVDPARATARLTISGSGGAGAPPPGGSSPAGGGTWFTRGLTGFDNLTSPCNPVPTVGATCSDTGTVCKANGLAYECRSKYLSVSVVGRVLDSETGQGIPGVTVLTHAVYGGFSKQVTTDASGEYKFDDFLSVYHVIQASKSGYIMVQGTSAPGPDRDISEPSATVGTLQADDILLAKRDENYVGPLQNIQGESSGDPIRFKNGNRKILYGTSADFVWAGLGRNGELCTYILIHPTNPSLNNRDPQMCSRRSHYARLDQLGYTYNSATDEWRARVDHSAYPIDLRYALAAHNPTTGKAATLVIDITPFASQADNRVYTPIFPAASWGTNTGWNFYLLPAASTKRIGDLITLSITSGQPGSTVTFTAEGSSRPGDSVEMASPSGTVNSQGHYSTGVVVRGIPRTVSFMAESPAKKYIIGGYADFHYGSGQTTPPPPGSGPSLFLNVKKNGNTVTSPITTAVGDQLRYEWGDNNPHVNTTYSSSFTTTAGDTSKCGVSGVWEVNQQNGQSGNKDRTVLSYQAGCSYIIKYRAVGSGQTAEKQIEISVTGSGSTTPPPSGGTCPAGAPGSGTFVNGAGQTVEWFCGLTRPTPNLAAPNNWTDQSPASCTATEVKCWHRIQPPPPSSPPPGGGGGGIGGGDSTSDNLGDFLRNLLNLIF